MNRTQVILKAPVQTADNPAKIYHFDDPVPRHRKNTGICVGGITNHYLQKKTLAGYASYIADSGDVISRTVIGNHLDQVKIGSLPIGHISNYGLLSRGKILCDDAAISADNTIIGMLYSIDSSSVVTVTINEYSQSGLIINTKSFSFQTFGTILQVKQLILVKYMGMHWNDYQSILISYTPYTDASGTTIELWTDSAGGPVKNTWAGTQADTFIWRFESGNGWISGIPGGKYYYSPSSGVSYTILTTGNVSYSIPIIVGSHSAVFLTQNLAAGSQLYGYVGYDSGAVFHSAMQWTALPAAITGVMPSADLEHQVGFGYVESNFTTTSTGAGNTTISMPTTDGVQATAGKIPGMLASGTITGFTNHYGRLSGTYFQKSAFPFEIRCGLTNGIQTFLSIASTYSSQTVGTAWGPNVSPAFPNINVTAVGFGNGIFIAGDGSGNISRSTDKGQTWSSPVGTTAGSFNSIVYGNGKWIATGYTGNIQSTDDGLTWTNLASITDTALIAFYANSVWLVGGGSTLHRSTDNGVTWSSISGGMTDLRAFAYGVSVLIMVGASGSSPILRRSTDLGLTWTTISTPITSTIITSASFVDNVFIIGAYSGQIARSTDLGLTWGSLITNPFGTDPIESISSGESTVMACTNSGKIAQSTDFGATWGALMSSPLTARGFQLTFGLETFMAAGSNATQPVISVNPPTSNVYEDTLGVLLTNPGEFDSSYTPHVVENTSEVGILYRFNNEFRFCFIGDISTGSGILEAIQKISKNLYKFNTISAGNIIDVNSGTLEIGSIDYNGRMQLSATATTQLVAQMINAKYCSSQDVGARTLSVAATGTAALAVSVKNVIQGTLPTQYEVDYFVFGTSGFSYVQSTTTSGSLFVDPDKSGSGNATAATSYIASLFVPPAMGYVYGDRFLKTDESILLLQWFYVDSFGNQHESDLYTIGNEITNFTVAFQLFGNVYVYDGEIVWLASITNSLYTGRRQIAIQTGLVFLCSGPDSVFFLSTFDNSVWVFTGGQSVIKLMAVNEEDPILSAVFNVRENTLCLLTDNSIIFVRDGTLISVLSLAVDQTNMFMYSTSVGIIFANNASSWQYSYNPIGTVEPLLFQSAFLGQGGFEKHRLFEFEALLYSAAPVQTSVSWNVEYYDDTQSYSYTNIVTINPSDFDSNGIARIRTQPEFRGLGTSVGIQCDSKITIVDIYCVWDDDGEGKVRQQLSA